MLTKEQALTAREFHVGECTRTEGPRGGVTVKQEVWRRSGQTKTWKTRPDDFEIPVKFGLYRSARITHRDTNVHVPADCPLNK